MRWLLLVSTVAAYGLSFTRHSAGAMGWWLLFAIIGSIATALAFAQARIANGSRGDSLSEYELKRLRDAHPAASQEQDRHAP
ncbi:MAG: hypothetical protein KGM46_08355 [Pseudomonadota bacterium]|jgi:hypothetical protein|nr:hypothetical protein [Xanthomonadaceae bacterium]MDE2247949.1 hypothetical protein [Xanthomonadaceae bacterium]MDE3210737.1 hypothetical protein [Pseudomonadota bacterium]